MKGGEGVGCRKLDLCEINGVLADSEKAFVTAERCCKTAGSEMCASAVKINGSYRLTLKGAVCNTMLNALASGEGVTVKYTGRNCCGKYCVTASGVPDSVTVGGRDEVTFTLSDFITDGIMKY